MAQGELRGSIRPLDYSKQRPSWEVLDRPGKIQRVIDLMTSPTFVRKGGRASGEDALLLKLEKEPEITKEIIATAEGRSAVVRFINVLYRSETAGRAYVTAQKAQRLFDFDPTPEERQILRDAELDCRAFAVGTRSDGTREEWLEDLSAEEKKEVLKRARRYALYPLDEM
jgi:hypothetical protein